MRKLWLASSSPRRRMLLEESGFLPECVSSDLDDDLLRITEHNVLATCAARAWFKAESVHALLSARAATRISDDPGVLIAADTLCDLDGVPLGKPSTADDAERMIRSLMSRTHRTVTGVAILDRSSMKRSIWCDVAQVELGALSEGVLASYLESGEWAGKSGGYNLADRVKSGWPVTCHDDPATVMGLPIKRLVSELKPFMHEVPSS